MRDCLQLLQDVVDENNFLESLEPLKEDIKRIAESGPNESKQDVTIVRGIFCFLIAKLDPDNILYNSADKCWYRKEGSDHA